MFGIHRCMNADLVMHNMYMNAFGIHALCMTRSAFIHRWIPKKQNSIFIISIFTVSVFNFKRKRGFPLSGCRPSIDLYDYWRLTLFGSRFANSVVPSLKFRDLVQLLLLLFLRNKCELHDKYHTSQLLQQYAIQKQHTGNVVPHPPILSIDEKISDLNGETVHLKDK